MAEKKQFKREVAKRMFLREMGMIELSYKKDENDQAPMYYLTPTGCECNRVFVVGVVYEVDDIGTDKPYYRAKLMSRLGYITVYAGEYNPEAAEVLASLQTPAYVSVIGKPNIYTPEDGDPIVSMRGERIAVVDKHTEQLWIEETKKQTLERIDAMLSGQLTGPMQEAMNYYKPDLEAMRSEIEDVTADYLPTVDASEKTEEVPADGETEEVETFDFSK